MFLRAAHRAGRPLFQVFLDNVCKHQDVVAEKLLQLGIQGFAASQSHIQLHLRFRSKLRRLVFQNLSIGIILPHARQFRNLQFALRQHILERLVATGIRHLFLQVFFLSFQCLQVQEHSGLFIQQIFQDFIGILATFFFRAQVRHGSRNLDVKSTHIVPKFPMRLNEIIGIILRLFRIFLGFIKLLQR